MNKNQIQTEKAMINSSNASAKLLSVPLSKNE